MRTTDKGDIAELAIAADLSARGYRVLIPFGVGGDYDLVIDRAGTFERVQVKYAAKVDGVIPVRTRTHSNTAKRQVTKRYTKEDIEWLAIYEPTTRGCYYLASSLLGTGRDVLHLRLDPPKKGQPNIRWASEYQSI